MLVMGNKDLKFLPVHSKVRWLEMLPGRSDLLKTYQRKSNMKFEKIDTRSIEEGFFLMVGIYYWTQFKTVIKAI